MLPAFRGGQYGEGILAGTTHVIQRIADARGATLANVPREAAEREDRPTFAIPIVPVLFVLFLITMSLNLVADPRFRLVWRDARVNQAVFWRIGSTEERAPEEWRRER